MKIALVSMVKNECDIIELFVRINARLVDHVFIVDNQSSDTTALILAKLQQEGLPITISTDPSVGHYQDRTLTRLIRQVAVRDEFDWILPLDADEFPQADRATLQAALEAAPPRHCGLMQWATFVPIREPMPNNGNYLWTDFRQRNGEPRTYDKVAVPVSLARTGKIGPGNHHFMDRFGNGRRMARLPIRIAHAPLRSLAQLVCKSIIGSHQMSVQRDRHPEAGFHWDQMAQRLRANAYRLDFAELQKSAFGYALQPGDPVPTECLAEPRIGSDDVSLHYPELATISIEGRFDAYMANLGTEIRRLQRATRWIPFVR